MNPSKKYRVTTGRQIKTAMKLFCCWNLLKYIMTIYSEKITTCPEAVIALIATSNSVINVIKIVNYLWCFLLEPAGILSHLISTQM